jgi:CDP-diacylglycerol--glycerol-3-phosphate 3-phosphatidyltransferase
MKQLANIITLFRIAGSLGLLFCDVTGVAFWIIYGLCGASDMADGWLSRKLRCVIRTGALLDSMADICFVACCASKLLPIFELPQWLWLWAGIIVAIKVVNQLLALVMYGRCRFPHTTANKATGFLLFIAVPMTVRAVIPIAFVAAIATFAAIQEEHFIRTRKNKMRKIVTVAPFSIWRSRFWPFLGGRANPFERDKNVAPNQGRKAILLPLLCVPLRQPLCALCVFPLPRRLPVLQRGAERGKKRGGR